MLYSKTGHFSVVRGILGTREQPKNGIVLLKMGWDVWSLRARVVTTVDYLNVVIAAADELVMPVVAESVL
jgi:hypothetical protein